MNSAFSFTLKSFLVYFTNLCASVATKFTELEFNSKKTPLITGLKSSFPLAKIVEFIAFKRTLDFKANLLESFKIFWFGKSSPSTKANEYFPLLAIISKEFLSVLIKVSGCSGKVFRVSNNNFADNPIFPESWDSISNLVVKVLSKSEAVNVSSFFCISNKF